MRKTGRRRVRRTRAGRREAAPWQREAARRWDRMFGGYRLAEGGSPCARCGCRRACEFADQYCGAFARWYAAAFDEAAGRVRRLAGR